MYFRAILLQVITISRIAHTQNCNGSIDLVFVLDDSGTICDSDPGFVYGRDTTCSNWQFITQFASNLISGMTIGTSNTLVGLVQFDSSAIVRWTLTTYPDKILLTNAITNLPYRGGQTDTTDGLSYMRTQVFGTTGDRSNFPNVAVVITDGNPNVNVDQLSNEIQNVQNSGIKVYVVGVTSNVSESTIQQISSAPHQLNTNYFIATDYSKVDAVRTQLVQGINSNCNSTVITSIPSTTTTPPQTVCPIGSTNIDLVFVLDDSGSICDTDPGFHYGVDITCNNWKFITQSASNIISGMTIGPSNTMVGMVQFDWSAIVRWTLNAYTDQGTLTSAITNLPFRGGQTDTTDGLNYMRTQVFGTSGDRSNFPNIAVVITDGNPNVNVDQLSNEIQNVQNAGIKVFVVGVTSTVTESTLQQISSAPHQRDRNYFIATDYSRVDSIRGQLLQEISSGCSTLAPVTSSQATTSTRPTPTYPQQSTVSTTSSLIPTSTTTPAKGVVGQTCTYTNLSPGQASYAASAQPGVNSQSACQTLCTKTPSCTSYQIDTNPSSAAYCWLQITLTASQVLDPNSLFPQSTVTEYVKSCSTGNVITSTETTMTATSTSSRGQTCIYTNRSPGQASYAASAQPGVNSQSDCMTLCTNTPACVSYQIDTNPSSAAYCWLQISLNASQVLDPNSLHPQSTVTEYVKICSTGNVITSTETTMTATSTSSRGDPIGMVVGMGVGIGVGGCIIFAIISLCLYMKCRRSKHKHGAGVTATEHPSEFTNRFASTTPNSFTDGLTQNGAVHYEGLNPGRNSQGTYDELNVTNEYETMDADGSQGRAIYDEINDKQYEKLNSGISVDENTYDRMNVEGRYDRSLDVTDSCS